MFNLHNNKSEKFNLLMWEILVMNDESRFMIKNIIEKAFNRKMITEKEFNELYRYWIAKSDILMLAK